MPTLSSTSPTLLDLSNRLDPDGGIPVIAEILNQTNDILDYIPWVEGNLPTGHQTTVRTGIPKPTWRKLYQGVQPTKSTTAKVTEPTGMMENYSQIDKALADINGNTATFRASEDRPIIQGFSHEFAANAFYGSEGANPERFTGFAARFNSKSASIQTSQQIIDGGGTGSTNTSIWLVGFSENTVHGIYPKGSKAGLSMRDLGEDTAENVNGVQGAMMQVYRTHYRWDVGLCVRDWRYIVRIPNIDVTQLTKDASAGADLVDLMTQAEELIQSLNDCTPVWACNRRVRGFLRRQMTAKIKQSTLSWEMVAGKRVMYFDEIPVVRCDSLLNTEAQVS